MKIQQKLLAALLGLATGASNADAAVRVYGEATSTGPTIEVQLFADIPSPAIVSHTFKLFYPASQLQVMSASRNESVWYFHNGTRTVPYPAPDSSNAGEVLFIGGHMDAREPLVGVQGNRVLLGTVLFQRSTPAVPSFDMSIGRSGQFASFVTVNGAVLEAAPGGVAFESVSPDPSDGDLDGLGDKWEENFFGSTRGVFWSDDSDKDGVNNRGEETAGSDPTDPESYLRLAIVSGREKLLLEWPSTEKRLYTIEAAKELNRFETLERGIEATPPLNSYAIDPAEHSDVLFFRVRVDYER